MPAPFAPANDSALKYRALTEISEAFLGSRDCDALFRGLWDPLSKLIRFDFLLLMLIDEQTRSRKSKRINLLRGSQRPEFAPRRRSFRAGLENSTAPLRHGSEPRN